MGDHPLPEPYYDHVDATGVYSDIMSPPAPLNSGACRVGDMLIVFLRTRPESSLTLQSACGWRQSP